MPAAVLVPLVTSAIAGGTAVTGAIINSRANSGAARTQADAAREAARIQQESQDKALAAEREQINFDRAQAAAQQASRAPYVQASNQSLAALSQQLGLPTFDPKAVPPSIAPQSLAQFNPNLPQQAQQPNQWGYGMPQTGNATNGAINVGALTLPPDDGTGTVLLVSPKGDETKRVPRSQAMSFMQRGAKLAQSGAA